MRCGSIVLVVIDGVIYGECIRSCYECKEKTIVEKIPEQLRKFLPTTVRRAYNGGGHGKRKIKIKEIWSGTRGASYIFVIKDGEILHISQLDGATECKQSLAQNSKEIKKRRARKRDVIFEVPIDEIANREGIWVDYSNSGNLFLRIIKFPCENELRKIETIDYKELIDWSDENIRTEDALNYIKKKIDEGAKFRVFGREFNICIRYLEYVPKLVAGIWNVFREIGIKEVYTERSRRLEEVLNDPVIGYIVSMLLPTEQGRMISLYGKISTIFELWIISKICEALSKHGRRVDQKDWIWIWKAKNEKFIEFDVHGRRWSIFYQPSILPHIISGLLPKDKLEKLKKKMGVKELHLIPDIILAVDIGERLDFGELYKIRDRVKLIIEAKFSLAGATKYDSVDYLRSQLDAYMKILDKSPANLLVVLLEENKPAKRELEDLEIRVVDDAINNSNEIVKIIENVLI